LGKRKIISEEEIETMVLPVANIVLGIAVRIMGYDRNTKVNRHRLHGKSFSGLIQQLFPKRDLALLFGILL